MTADREDPPIDVTDELTELALTAPAADAPVKKKRRKKTLTPADEDRQATTEALLRLEAAFKSAFQRRYRFAMERYGGAMYRHARDRKLLKDLIGNVGEAEAITLIDDFFFKFDTDRDIRWRTRAGTVPEFIGCIPRLLVLRNGGVPTDERTAHNDREIDKAMGRRS